MGASITPTALDFHRPDGANDGARPSGFRRSPVDAAAGRRVPPPHLARSTSTPGRALPSSHSRKAPPAVEMKRNPTAAPAW